MVSQVVLAVALFLALGTGCASWEGFGLYRSGTQALDRGQTGAAIADLERAAALVPEASEVQNHLGLAYLAAGRDDDAQQAFERALVLDCDNQAARQNRAVAEQRRAGGP